MQNASSYIFVLDLYNINTLKTFNTFNINTLESRINIIIACLQINILK